MDNIRTSPLNSLFEKWNKNIEKIKEFSLELLFPSFCLGCKKEGTYLCHDCKSTLEISEYNYCLCNKNPFRLPTQAGLPPNRLLTSPDEGSENYSRNENSRPQENSKCSKCQVKKISGLYFALPYKENFLARKLIHQFKYQPYIKDLAKILTGLLIEHLILTNKNTEETWGNSALIPIPLEKNKLKSRGYNQAEELAKELSKILKVPLILDNLVKVKKTPPQMELSAQERLGNLKNAFLIKNTTDIADKKIFLVDDVYTTGATMEECAHVLRDAGAKSVWGITIAREG